MELAGSASEEKGRQLEVLRGLPTTERRDGEGRLPPPPIDESLDCLGHSKYFSTLDLTSGYWQVELEEDAKEKTAFTTRNGLYQWEVLPFGLTSAPSIFERLMETALRGLHWKTVLIYLDDIIVFCARHANPSYKVRGGVR